MPISKAKLKAILNQHGLPTATQQAILDDALRITTLKKGNEHDSYTKLLADLARARDTMRTNMSNRSAQLRPIYEEYVGILDKVRERIHKARLHGDLATATREAALVNEQRAQDGARPGPANGSTWQSWVPPHIRQAFEAKVVQTYATIGIVKGNRFKPFVPSSMQRVVKKNENILRKSIERIRDTHENAPGTGVAYTPYRALYLCAVRMAEVELGRRLKEFELGSANPVDSPLPVNWLALLDGTMRARLRAAQTNPALVSPEGLGHFLVPAPDNVLQDMTDQDIEHAAAHPVEELPDAPI